MTILFFIIILSFLVLIHEWGHYIVAKIVGIHVEEFGIGYPPRLKKLFSRKGTLFSLNWLPFGGFVRLAGDDGETVEGSGESLIEKEKLFREKSKIQRLCVIAAGAFVNILFGIFAFAVLYMILGIPEQMNHPRIDRVIADSPAALVRLQKDDTILRVDGKDIISSEMFITEIQLRRGKIISLDLERDNKIIAVAPYIRTEAETPQDQGSLGVSLIDVEWKRYPWYVMIGKGVWKGMQDSYAFSHQILQSLHGMVIQVAEKRTIPKDISGPIGIVHMAEKEKLFEQGPMAWLNFAGLLSINLGVMNLLPIPALDGGRGFFIFLEVFIGKVRRAQYEQYTNAFGMLALLVLIVLISIKDVLVWIRP